MCILIELELERERSLNVISPQKNIFIRFTYYTIATLQSNKLHMSVWMFEKRGLPFIQDSQESERKSFNATVINKFLTETSSSFLSFHFICYSFQYSRANDQFVDLKQFIHFNFNRIKRNSSQMNCLNCPYPMKLNGFNEKFILEKIFFGA